MAAASGSSTSMSRKRASHSSLIKPGALRLQLVRQAAGAEDHDPVVARVRVDRTPDRLAEPVAPVAGGRRVLDDVDGERDHLARPRLGLPEGDRQRHRETVVDLHLVDEREVELVEDQRLGEVPGQLGVADRPRARAAGRSPRRRCRSAPPCRARRSGSARARRRWHGRCRRRCTRRGRPRRSTRAAAAAWRSTAPSTAPRCDPCRSPRRPPGCATCRPHRPAQP